VAIRYVNQSKKFRDRAWVVCDGAPLERIEQHVATRGGTYALQFLEPHPGNALFALELSPSPAEHEGALEFSWMRREGLPLPSLFGTINATGLGRVAILSVSAQYVFGNDPASRLAHEVLGPQCAAYSLQGLLQALRAMFGTIGRFPAGI
jgi:hypothetical protein